MVQSAGDSTQASKQAGLTRQIADSVRDEIIYGQLEVGQRLPAVTELARRFQASLPTLREVMKLLAAQHLIRSKRGPCGGIFVNRPSLGQANRMLTSVITWLVTLGAFSLEDITEARRHLGSACVSFAAQRRSERDVELIERELRRMSDASLSNQEFCSADTEFYRAIASASGNKVLQLVMLIISDSLGPATNMVVFRFHERETIMELNSRVLAAIHSRRLGNAEDSFATLIDYLGECYAAAAGRGIFGQRLQSHLRAVK